MSAQPSASTDPFGDDWVRERPRRADFRADVVAALLLLVGTAVSMALYAIGGQTGPPPPMWVCFVWLGFISLPLAFRRRLPEIVAVVVAIAFYAGQSIAVPEYLFNSICLFIAIYTLGAWGRRRRLSIVLRVAIIVGMFLWLVYALVEAASASTTLSTDAGGGIMSPYVASAILSIIINLLYFGGAYYFGEVARQSARRREALEARTAELASERERSSAQAVTIERVRIARELHDVVAHHVSVMGVQAGAARRVLDRDPTKATVALTAIEASARQAVDELHRMLSALRSHDAPLESGTVADASDPGGSPTSSESAEASTLGIDQLPALVEGMSAAELPVAFAIIGERRPAPATVELTAYRIVQESLTNVRKHAGAGATASVRLRFLENELEIEVSDTGAGASTSASSSSFASSSPLGAGSGSGSGGLGQIGMRERVAAVGGSISLGRKVRGGYLVRARLPAPSRQAAVLEDPPIGLIPQEEAAVIASAPAPMPVPAQVPVRAPLSTPLDALDEGHTPANQETR